MLTLPKDLLREILSFLTKSDLVSFRNVCNLFRKVTDETFLSITYRTPGKGDGILIPHFPSCSHVENLDLRSTSVEDQHLSHLSQTKLKMLDLSWCKLITDDSMKFLPHSLEVLKLTSCNIGDNGLKFLPSSLTELDLFCCYKISDEGIANIQHLPLVKLVLHGKSKLTEECLMHLPPTLKELELQQWKNFSKDSCEKLPKITTLALANCSSISNEMLSYLPSSLINLKLIGCTELTEEGIKNLPPKLMHLNISGCSNATDDWIGYFPENLFSLNISYTKISDEGLKKLPPKLKQLFCVYCEKITPDGIKNLPSELQILNATGCVQAIVDEILGYLPKRLISLNATGCSKLTGQEFHNLPSTLRELDLTWCTKVIPNNLKQLPKCVNKLSTTGCAVSL